MGITMSAPIFLLFSFTEDFIGLENTSTFVISSHLAFTAITPGKQ
jgi:hypothetical protein